MGGNGLLEDKKCKIYLLTSNLNWKSEDQLVHQGSGIFEPSKLIYSCTYLHPSKKRLLRLSSRDTSRYRSGSSKHYRSIYTRLQELNHEAAANLSSTLTFGDVEWWSHGWWGRQNLTFRRCLAVDNHMLSGRCWDGLKLISYAQVQEKTGRDKLVWYIRLPTSPNEV